MASTTRSTATALTNNAEQPKLSVDGRDAVDAAAPRSA
jgi:hypothetical protein